MVVHFELVEDVKHQMAQLYKVFIFVLNKRRHKLCSYKRIQFDFFVLER